MVETFMFRVGMSKIYTSIQQLKNVKYISPTFYIITLNYIWAAYVNMYFSIYHAEQCTLYSVIFA